MVRASVLALAGVVGLASASSLGGLAACGGSLPRPRLVGQPTEALVPTLYPPPPARAEYVPEAPKDDAAVWVDGEWTWQGRRWAWKPGRWVVPPKGAAFSPWTTVRDETGSLFVAEGRWRDAQGKELPDPVPISTGRTRAGKVTDPEGDEVPPTPNAPARSPVAGDAGPDAAAPVDDDDAGPPR